MSLVYDILYSSWIKPKGNRLEFSDFNEKKCSISQNLVPDEKLFPCWFDLNESKQWSYFFSWENCNFPKFIHSNQIEFVGENLVTDIAISLVTMEFFQLLSSFVQEVFLCRTLKISNYSTWKIIFNRGRGL